MPSTLFETAAGFCGIAWSEAGVTRFVLPVRDPDDAARRLRQRETAAPTPAVAAAIARAARYFNGERVDFADVALDLGAQTEFCQAVYAATRRLGWGVTTTYGALARAVGAGPEAARDVGQAMARNPVPLLIPCHRVLAAGGALGGFSAPGGAATKQRMLALEGVEPAQGSLAL